MKKVKNIITTYLGPLAYDIFIASLLVYTASLLLETFKKGVVVDYFNIQNLLIVCVVSGIVAIVLPAKGIEKKHPWTYGIITTVISIISGYYVWSYTVPNSYAWLFALVTAMALATVGYVLYITPEEPNDK